jgi:uncharacterized protein (DUF2147 family)
MPRRHRVRADLARRRLADRRRLGRRQDRALHRERTRAVRAHYLAVGSVYDDRQAELGSRAALAAFDRMEMLTGFRPAASGEWSGGHIYNPEDGNTYGASLRIRDATALDVRGCVLFICRSQVWRRPSALPR